MSNYDNLKQLFEKIKGLPESEVSKCSIEILESFIFLEKAEQKEFAESIYKWAVPFEKKRPLFFCYSKFIWSFSLFYRELYDEAFPLIIETQNQFTEQNDLNGTAICILLQGSIYRTFGNLDLALKSLWTAHEQLKTAVLYQHFLMACNITIAGTYVEMKHNGEAIPLFNDTLELAKKTNRYYWIIYALHGLGKVYLMQKKYQEAKTFFEQAMKAAETFQNPVSLSNSLSELGNYYFTICEFSTSEQFHQKALILREQNQLIGGAITSYIRLGEIYIKLVNPEEAIVILNKGLILAENLKIKPKMYQIHFLLSEIYQSKNDMINSLSHFKLFHELREQVEIEDNIRKMKNMQLVFEAEQTKKENIIIKKQKQEIEQKNIELQETIDELTLAKVGKKARAITLIIAIILFILEDEFILHFALSVIPAENHLISLVVKMVIIFSLSPINSTIEHYLLRRIIKKRKREVLV